MYATTAPKYPIQGVGVTKIDDPYVAGKQSDLGKGIQNGRDWWADLHLYIVLHDLATVLHYFHCIIAHNLKEESPYTLD